ncbi:MAG: dephospho-CoA kinase [Oscillospiraceae bacterium]|nr:dephospho-CoA kinase [Oscillospiraceae bacterium]
MSDERSTAVIGLTGQTGAGKSTVSGIFVQNGFVLLDADRIAHEIMEPGRPCVEELFDYFGEGIRCPDGSLDRRALAAIVFSDKRKLESLNSISHPYITEEIFRRISRLTQEGQRLVLLDAPTLFESKASDFCDLIISVIAEPERRLTRIMQRDALTREQALARMNAQLDEAFFIRHSDFVIRNNADLETLAALSGEVADKIRLHYHAQTAQPAVS